MRLTISVILLLAMGCSGNSSGTLPDNTPQKLGGLLVTVSPSTVVLGQTAAATAVGIDQNGVSMPAGAVTWTTAPEGIISVTGDGVVTPVMMGTVTLTATRPGLAPASATIIVRSPFTWGQEHGGGTICHVDQTGLHGLIRAKVRFEAPWGSSQRTQARSTTDGAANTTAIINVYGTSGTYAALVARNYRGGGYTDWFLPAIAQLQACARVDPYESNWSSTEVDLNDAWTQVNFSSAAQLRTKYREAYVWPVRQF